eukprot:c17064_g1_i1 orf=1-1407(-)
MYEGVTSYGMLAQPWSSCNNHNPSVLGKGNSSNMMNNSSVDMRASMSFNCEYDNIIGSHIDEDFFIEDLSEFSNEDIAAPIINKAHAFQGPSSLHSDDHSASDLSKDPSSCIKSDCTTTAHTSPSGSVLPQDSTTAAILDCRSALPVEIKESPLSLPCQDETGFDWLTSFGEDNLMYGASNLSMDSFLLSNAEPFGDYDGLMMKHGGYEDAIKVKDIKMGHNISGASTNDERSTGHGSGDNARWNNENGAMKSCDAMMFTPHATGSRSARSKRARSAGWSSSNILCNNWDNDSPTNSLNSTSQIMPTPPQYSSPPLINVCKQEENNEQHDYSNTHHMELISASFTSAPKSDHKPLKFCSNDQALNGSWAKEETNTREESVGNYGGLQPRRCTHCLSQKTPQWRAGPEGPKTLCNACGVRFKSGRLFDEYRPAKSPTFLSYKHSNSHKKVMEMRRRKTFHYTHHHQQQQQ